ncbi:MAG: phospholipase D-like domain-containing protein [Bacteroidota bacterium]
MKKLRPISFILIVLFSFTHLQAQLFEDVEQGTKNTYSPFSVELASGVWMFDDALIGTLASDKKNGQKSARIRDGFLQMEFDYPMGMSEVSFYAANFGTDSGGSLQVSWSDDAGETWNALGEPVSVGEELEQYSLQQSVNSPVRLRFEKTAGTRINVDDILISDYIETVTDPSLLVRINEIPYPTDSTFDFGLNTGTASAELQLRNTGEEDLIISSHLITGDEFTVDGDLNVTLGQMETASFTLMFVAAQPGISEATLTLASNDPANPQYELHLTAEALDTSQPISIADARQLPQGTEVTISGWVTVASQFKGPLYMQDETAGIAWYNGAIMEDEWLVGAFIGDSIVLTGELGNFNNLLQIVNDSNFEVFPDANREIEPSEISLEQLNSGDYEGQLIRLSNIEFEDPGVFAGGNNYMIFEDFTEGELRVDNNTNIPGSIIPTGLTEITGVAGRYYDMHQIMPRFTDDIVQLSGPIILTAPPYETSATATSISFAWETQLAGHSEIRYGTTSELEMGNVTDDTHKTQHEITLDGLDPATIYKVQLRSAFDADTSATNIYITTTGSPAGTTGEVLTFFNKDVEHELATFREADQNVDFSQKLIEYIQQAEQSAVFAFYNISGAVGEEIAGEIIAAHERGVDIRVIVSGHTGNPNAVATQLANAGVKTAQSIGTAQMHNKFAVFDALHNDPAKPFVITSSWNATDQGTYEQYQNMVIVQDVALAKAYLEEFNQMWGAESGAFNSSQALFSFEKSVVNPTQFWIGEDEIKIEAYFSPQANTEAQINRTLSQAQESIDLSLNLITRRTISNVIRERFDHGVDVRGVIGSIGEQNTQFNYMSSWADLHHFSQDDFGLLHHKYAIIDGLDGLLDSKVITGSHNWSANANFINDENILIIHDPRVANEYFQEYAARYWQAGGEEEFDVTISVDEHGWQQNPTLTGYPNPFSNQVSFKIGLESAREITLEIYDITGRLMATPLYRETLQSGTHKVQHDTSQLQAGVYFYRLLLKDGTLLSGKLVKVE